MIAKGIFCFFNWFSEFTHHIIENHFTGWVRIGHMVNCSALLFWFWLVSMKPRKPRHGLFFSLGSWVVIMGPDQCRNYTMCPLSRCVRRNALIFWPPPNGWFTMLHCLVWADLMSFLSSSREADRDRANLALGIDQSLLLSDKSSASKDSSCTYITLV